MENRVLQVVIGFLVYFGGSAGLQAQQINPGTQIKWPTACAAGQAYLPFSNTCGTTATPGITALTGPVTAFGTGSVATTITPTGVASGCYTLGSQAVCFNAAGQATAVGNPFGVSLSCSAAGTYEVGNATANPNVCAFAYANGTAASASLTDGSHTAQLVSPYSSGSLAVSYCTGTQGQSSFTFTGSATTVNGQTASAATGTACLDRTFSGAGAAGATGATASGTNAVLSGVSGTLASSGLGNQGSFGCIAAGQKCYVLMLGAGHTFTSGGFAFPMNTPTAITFANQYGAAVAMFLYESTNLLGSPGTPASFPLVVASFMIFPFARRRRRGAAVLCGLLMAAGSARAQVQLGGHVIVPSTSDSVLGSANVAMTSSTCVLVSATGCTVTGGPYVKTLNVTGSPSACAVTVVASPGREYTVYNGTGVACTVGASGATVTVPSGTSPVTISSPDGVNYYTSASGGGGGSGTVGTGTAGQFAFYAASGSSIAGHTLAVSDITSLGTLSNSTTGNAATSSALFAYPTQCQTGYYAQGVTAMGSANCIQAPVSGVPAGTPTGMLQAAAGTGATTLTVTGISSSMSISFTTGTTPSTAGGDVMDITFPSAYTTVHTCSLSPLNDQAASRNFSFYITNVSTTGFSIFNANPDGSLNSADTYIFAVQCGAGGANGADGAPGLVSLSQIQTPVQQPASSGYGDNFDTETVGAIATNWTAAVGTWAVGTAGPVSTPNTFGSTTHNDGDVALLTGVAAAADMTEFFQEQLTVNNANIVGAALRMDAAYQNGYVIVAYDSGNIISLIIFKRTSGGFAQIAQAGSVSVTTGVYSFKAQIVGSTIQGKIWLSSTAEPSAWTVTVTDTSVTAPGYAGLYSSTNAAFGIDNFNLVAAGVSGGPSSGPQSLTFPQYGDVTYEETLTANTSVTITPAQTTGILHRITFIVHPAGYALTLPVSGSSVIWRTGVAPTLSTTQTSVVQFLSTGVGPVLGGW